MVGCWLVIWYDPGVRRIRPSRLIIKLVNSNKYIISILGFKVYFRVSALWPKVIISMCWPMESKKTSPNAR